MGPVDEKKLAEIRHEMLDLQRRGEWTSANYQRLFDAAKAAVNGDGNRLFFLMRQEPGGGLQSPAGLPDLFPVRVPT